LRRQRGTEVVEKTGRAIGGKGVVGVMLAVFWREKRQEVELRGGIGH
jgi:hypothetical protein